MINIEKFIKEGLRINKNIKINKVKNNIDVSKLKYFKQKDVDRIVNWVNKEMPEDIQPVILTNVRKNVDYDDPSYIIYLLYTENYEHFGIYDIPYVRFYCSDYNELSVQIYDNVSTKYYNSKEYNIKDLDKCFDYIESKHDVIKNIID